MISKHWIFSQIGSLQNAQRERLEEAVDAVARDAHMDGFVETVASDAMALAILGHELRRRDHRRFQALADASNAWAAARSLATETPNAETFARLADAEAALAKIANCDNLD